MPMPKLKWLVSRWWRRWRGGAEPPHAPLPGPSALERSAPPLDSVAPPPGPTRNAPAINPSAIALNLALQGGGAHGAFTWGVLDALLEHAPRHWQWSTLSGASAGAVNAVVFAHGLRLGGSLGAREALQTFWLSMDQGGLTRWLTMGQGEDTQWSPWGQAAMHWAQWMSPSQLNPLGVDPLRDHLAAHVDFEALRRSSPVRLRVSATHARSGRHRIFTEREISLDMVMASACLPQWHRGVALDGEIHWDGGYSANPPLIPLALDAEAAPDTLLVPLTPPTWHDAPTQAADIRQRLADLAFQGPWVQALQVLQSVQEADPTSAIGKHRWHLVDGTADLAKLPRETKAMPTESLVRHLHGLGHLHALAWLDQHGAKVGVESSWNPSDWLAPLPRIAQAGVPAATRGPP